MIKLPCLDDQNYADIVEAAKRRIPVIFPEWTDFNEHDPGITIIELFAWLKEMQQYYLNRISDRSYENMLRLLGVNIIEPAPSESFVCFGSDSVPESLPKGCTAKAPDGTIFTSEDEFRSMPFKLGKIFIENADGFVDITDIASSYNTSFYPFGKKLFSDNCRMYIELRDVEVSRMAEGISLWFSTDDRCAVQRNPVTDSSYIPRDVVWEYSTSKGFAECEVIKDGTCAFSYSGEVVLRPAEDIAVCDKDGLPQGQWLRVRLAYSGCEDMPQLKAVYTNVLRMVQKRVDAATAEFVLNGNEVYVRDRLAAEGLCFVLIRDSHGWMYVQDVERQLVRDGVKINLGQYAQSAVADGAPNVRVIYCEENFGRNKMFMSSDGLPCQQFEFDVDGLPLTSELRVMVMDRQDSRYPRWREYSYIESLELAGPYDLCFSYDADRRRLMFGDNENAEAPPIGDENIMIISCSATSGAHGNMPTESLDVLRAGDELFPVKQYSACSGGKNRESFRHAIERLKASLSDCTRTVTAEDYRTIAMRTPGLRIADAKAIPFYSTDTTDSRDDNLANTISLVVLPYSTGMFPMPDSRFLRAVEEYIENYRLITTRINVIAPIYVKIDINADIVCDTREVAKAKQRSEDALRSLLAVYGEDGRTHFGEPVGESDIIARICSVDGILSVKRLNISTEMAGCSRDKYGRLVIPPHAIAYCGEVTLNITEP